VLVDGSDIRAGCELDCGKDPDQRKAHEQLESAKNTAKVLNVIGWPLCLWGWIYPRPYPLAMLALVVLPLVAIVLVVRSNGLYEIAGIRGDRRPSLVGLFLCGMVLFIRALEDIRLLQWPFLVVPAIVGGSALTLVALTRDRRMREGSWALVWLIAILYSYGAIAEANTLFDSSKPEIFQANVVGKRSYGGGLHTDLWYYLRLDRWGQSSVANDVHLPFALYRSVSIGQRVCVSVYPGALKIRWYSVNQCR
jgi:hypothetical protein